MTFPNQLADPKPVRLALTTAGTTLACLFALCLVPRALMILRVPNVCPDGAFFISKAQSLESNPPTDVHDQYDFNVYPLLLAGLHRTGLDWETAAKLWGVFSASLVVLPLFGWVRRMFDDRVAVLACVLYAAHPKLIEWSPEVIRGSTFWLLFTLSIYCSWRAVTEVRAFWFFAAGVATFLAIHTRFEGWALLIPMVLWCGWRMLALKQSRPRLATGVAAFALCYPLMISVLMFGYGYQRWEWGSFHRLNLVTSWVQSKWDGEVQPAASDDEAPAPTQPTPGEEAPAPTRPAPGESLDAQRNAKVVANEEFSEPPEQSGGVGQTVQLVLGKILRGFSPLFIVLLLVGMARWWRVWLRRDHHALLLLGLATLAAVWVHASISHASSSRYFLPLVILATPFAALGLLPLCRLAARMAGGFGSRRFVAPVVAATTLLVVILLAGVCDALTSQDKSRDAKADLGRWLFEHGGRDQLIAGSYKWTLVAYYARGEYRQLPFPRSKLTAEWLSQELKTLNPAVVLLPKRLSVLVDVAIDCGFVPVDSDRLPLSCRNNVVVVTKRPLANQADKSRLRR